MSKRQAYSFREDNQWKISNAETTPPPDEGDDCRPCFSANCPDRGSPNRVSDVQVSGCIFTVDWDTGIALTEGSSRCDEIGEAAPNGLTVSAQGNIAINTSFRARGSSCGIGGVVGGHYVGGIRGPLYSYLDADTNPAPRNPCCDNQMSGSQDCMSDFANVCFFGIYFNWVALGRPGDPNSNWVKVNGQYADWVATVQMFLNGSPPDSIALPLMPFAQFGVFAEYRETIPLLDTGSGPQANIEVGSLYGFGCGFTGAITPNFITMGGGEITQHATFTPGTVTWDASPGGRYWYPNPCAEGIANG